MRLFNPYPSKPGNPASLTMAKAGFKKPRVFLRLDLNSPFLGFKKFKNQ